MEDLVWNEVGRKGALRKTNKQEYFIINIVQVPFHFNGRITTSSFHVIDLESFRIQNFYFLFYHSPKEVMIIDLSSRSLTFIIIQ